MKAMLDKSLQNFMQITPHLRWLNMKLLSSLGVENYTGLPCYLLPTSGFLFCAKDQLFYTCALMHLCWWWCNKVCSWGIVRSYINTHNEKYYDRICSNTSAHFIYCNRHPVELPIPSITLHISVLA